MKLSRAVSTRAARGNQPRHARSIERLLEPLEALAGQSASLIANHGASFTAKGARYELPRYLYLGPKGGGDPIRVGVFATLHGDELMGAAALAEWVRQLEQEPEVARGYCLFIYPLCNPTGYEDGTRCSRRGRDLNREFWNHSVEPEVQLLQSELCCHAFDGVVTLYSDRGSAGVYGFANGATHSQHVLEPALAAAEAVLPRNRETLIDGFPAANGIIREMYRGALSAPLRVKPRPFEIALVTPRRAPQAAQAKATVAALRTFLIEYRKLISYAANL